MDVDLVLKDASSRLRDSLHGEPVPPRRSPDGPRGWLVIAAALTVTILTLGGVALVNGNDGESKAPPTTTGVIPEGSVDYQSREHGYSVMYPFDWHRATEPLASDLTSPPHQSQEILSLGTFPLRPGGTACPHVPENAIRDLGPDDALVSLIAAPSAPPSTPPWPRAFGPDVFLPNDTGEADSYDARTCTGRGNLDVRYGVYALDGRLITVMVAFGDQVDEATVDETWSILSSFAWTGLPRPTTRTTSTTTPLPDTADPSTGPLFGESANVVLVFDNGGDAVIAIDPDRRLVSQTVLEGHGGGDPPYRIARAGDSIIVGWGTVYADHIVTSASTELGDATIFIPAAEPGRVWLVKWAGGCTGCGSASAWQVDTSGRELTEPTEIALELLVLPVIGVTGGLAVQTSDGIRIWYPDDRSTVDLGTGNVLAAHGDRVAYCTEASCTEVRITDLRTGETQSLFEDDGFRAFAFGGHTARFSPGGNYLALTSNRGVTLFDTEVGTTTRVIDDLGSTDNSYLYVNWSPDGAQLFAATYSYGDDSLDIARYDVGTGSSDVARLPFGGTIDFVVLDPDEAGRFLDGADDPAVSF